MHVKLIVKSDEFARNNWCVLTEMSMTDAANKNCFAILREKSLGKLWLKYLYKKMNEKCFIRLCCFTPSCALDFQYLPVCPRLSLDCMDDTTDERSIDID